MTINFTELPDMELVSLDYMEKDIQLTCKLYTKMVEGMIILLSDKNKSDEYLSIVKEFEHYQDTTLATITVNPLIRNDFKVTDIESVSVWGHVDLNED
jgi:hypothetical protein